ncbi:MAG: hypothetical protein WD003_01295 [Candidatus Paceibacterota bacterium]
MRLRVKAIKEQKLPDYKVEELAVKALRWKSQVKGRTWDNAVKRVIAGRIGREWVGDIKAIKEMAQKMERGGVQFSLSIQ